MPSKFIVIKRASIKKANANPVSYVAGTYAITAIGGFVKHLEHIASQLADEPIRTAGFSIVHHDIELKAEDFGRGVQFHQHRSAAFMNMDDYSSKSVGSPVLSLQPTAYADLVISVVIKVDDGAGFIEAAFKQLSDSGKLKIAGGYVDDFKLKVCDFEDQATRFIGTGFTVLDCSDLVTEYLQAPKPNMLAGYEVSKGSDVLDAMLYYTNPTQAKEYSWLALSPIGYRLISDIEQRDGARNNLPHAFCEMLVGLIGFTSMREKGLSFWSFKDAGSNSFVFSS